MIDIKLINKPISVPIRYNAYYKLVLLLAIIEHCAMGKQASLQLIHFVFWGLRSEDNYKIGTVVKRIKLYNELIANAI